MAARIPQHIREEQIKSLCEGTLYSFVAWEGKYKNKYSKFICKCSHHGNWCVTVDSFVNNFCRCTKCGIETNRLRYVKDMKQREKEILERCEITSYVFLKWVNGHRNNQSKIELSCTKHGKFVIPFYKYVLSKQGCSKCGRERQMTSAKVGVDVREKNIKKRCKKESYIFNGWFDDDRNCNAKLKIQCVHHGEWIVGLSHFLNHKTGCPSCHVAGFKSNKPGFLYLLISEGGQYLKVGITNNKNRRIRELRHNTPFDFQLLRIKYFENGKDAMNWEKCFHSNFTSSQLKNFDGATEWLKWNREIPLWFDFI